MRAHNAIMESNYPVFFINQILEELPFAAIITAEKKTAPHLSQGRRCLGCFAFKVVWHCCGVSV